MSTNDNLPRIHHRERLVTDAECKLRQAITDSGINDLKLTTAEYLQVIARVMHEQVTTTLKYCIRRERHGNDDKPGGLE